MENKGYYLGISTDGLKIYLKKPSWDCGWYWGFGYLDGYNAKGKPTLKLHTHFDTMFLDTSEHIWGVDKIKQYFKTIELDDRSLWKLCDYMKSFYTLRDAAEVLFRGNSNITSRVENIASTSLSATINHEILPDLFRKIDALFE